jgi:DNA repair protein RadC
MSLKNPAESAHPAHSANTIKEWSPEDRPREKLMLKGRAALSDAELIAILLGSGTPRLSAVELARQILNLADYNLHALASFTMKDFLKVKGVGEAKALTIIAALELGRRRKSIEAVEKPRVRSSKDSYELLKAEMMDVKHEAFWIILLNRANRLISKQLVSQGGVSGTVADPKIIFKFALDSLASGIVLAHNHPSGNLKASEADISLTRKVIEAGKLLDIQVLDHLIFAGQSYLSFADEGLL